MHSKSEAHDMENETEDFEVQKTENKTEASNEPSRLKP
jgi:hypothetical protein